MAEEEKAAATTGPLSSLEDLFAVRLWAQALLQNCRIRQVLAKSIHEELPLMESDLNVGVDSHVDFFG